MKKKYRALKELQAVVDTKNRIAYLNFEGKLYEVDLTEGDLHDNWNSITTEDGRVFDFNLDWDDDDESPSISIYGTYQEAGEEHLRTDFSDAYSFVVKEGYDKDEYFKTRYRRVFQMGFDIAEGDSVQDIDYELEALFDNIEYLINKHAGFKSVGCFNVQDMSHAYREEELKQINNGN